jgi:hypothetical protein
VLPADLPLHPDRLEFQRPVSTSQACCSSVMAIRRAISSAVGGSYSKVMTVSVTYGR